MGRVIIFPGAIAAFAFAAAMAQYSFGFLKPPPAWIGVATVGVYMLAVLGVWASARHMNWRGAGGLAGLAFFTGVVAIVAYAVMLWIQTKGFAGALNPNPLAALAENAIYVSAMLAAVALVMLLVSLAGFVLLGSITGRGGPVWTLAGLGLLIASLSMAAALALLVYGALQDPSLAELGLQILPYSVYANIAAWVLAGLAMLVTLGKVGR